MKLKPLLAAVTLTLGLVTVFAITGGDHPEETLPTCTTEDTIPATGQCYWDSTRQGNGQGESFIVDSTGNIQYVGN